MKTSLIDYIRQIFDDKPGAAPVVSGTAPAPESAPVPVAPAATKVAAPAPAPAPVQNVVAAPVVKAAPEVEHAQVVVQVEKVNAVIGSVSDVTSAVAADVGQHNVNVQAISAELKNVAKSDPSAVAAIVCKLLLANQDLQGRLEKAEDTLQNHSKQLKEAVISSRTDGLTGLANRRLLDEELRRCLVELQGQGRPAALLMLDVDHFKRFNDTYGHVAGDQALIHVAEMLRSQARASDIVARFGGEEFAVVFTGVQSKTIKERAERLRLAIGGKTLLCDGKELQITASAGLAEAMGDDTVSDWIKRADAGLYAAKRAGRNRAFMDAGEGLEPLDNSPPEPSDEVSSICDTNRVVNETAADLAAEAFADTTFVPNVAKRIAEWKRGGATLTVVLAELDASTGASDEEPAEGSRPIRLALQWARGCVREMDVVSKWKKRGLAILLPCTSAADAKTVARRLHNALAQHAAAKGGEEAISLSVGIAEGIEGNDAKRLLERALMAMEAARKCGPGETCVHDGVKTVGVKKPVAGRS